ncbi:unnamed protein product [Parnassius apollo]|uniref:(apollo) hypothetical protein n=1 Tax=Parnassius apollo TaxID=110799 RepID=A0A8S3X0K7_PARAO|nr:unnamed protein product [Parnassius apollo]
MPPTTAAEKQKKYRDKLKKENPQKYEEIQKKVKERCARYYEKKRVNILKSTNKNYGINGRKIEKKQKMASQNEPGTAHTSNSKQDNNQLTCRNMQRRIEYRLKQETAQLRLQLNTLTKDETKDTYTQELEEKTPRKEVTEFINNNIPNIETPKKEEVKKKLLEHDVLTKSLKLQFQTANNTEKNVLRNVLDNNILKKYKLKTRLRTSLGFKSDFKNYRHQKIRTTALQKKIECFLTEMMLAAPLQAKKEYRTFKKVTRQKRYLLNKLIVLHRKSIAEEVQISFSTFKKYRPFYVFSPKINDCESCSCKKHSNMQFLVDELKSLNILKTDNLNEVTTDLVCDFYSKDCMYNNCNTCSEIRLKVDNEELSAKVSWFTWILKDHEYEKEGEKKKIKKIIKIKKEGKGAPDGIGGAIKRTLDAKIAQGKDIPNAETAFDILNSEDTSIKLFYISSVNIKPLHTKLSPLPQTMKIHQLITIEKLKLKYRDLSCFYGDPRGNCEYHSPVAHSFLPTIYANEKHTSNKQEKCEKKKEVKNSKNSNKTRRRRVSSSTKEDEYDDRIEYTESDASAFFSDESISLDFNDDENNLITELDEKTGVLRPKINPNKKVTLLSTIILKKPNAENNPKHERKRKIICENEDSIHKRFCETTKHVTGKDDVTILSQIRKNPENTASYDLRESYLFGKEEPIKEIRSNKIETDKRKIDQNRENKNDTKKEIKKNLKEKFLIEDKHKIEIECTKKDESKEILIVIAEEERKEADENP